MTSAAPPIVDATGTWRDSKRYLWLIGLVVPSLAFVALGMHALTDWAVWLWLGPAVSSWWSRWSTSSPDSTGRTRRTT